MYVFKSIFGWCHGPASEATYNPLLSLAQEENRSDDLSRDFLTDCYSVVTNGSTPLGWRGRHWNALECPGRVFATGLTGGLRPINTAYLPTIDSVVVYRQSITTYRPSIKGDSLKPDLYQVCRLNLSSLASNTRLSFSLQL